MRHGIHALRLPFSNDSCFDENARTGKRYNKDLWEDIFLQEAVLLVTLTRGRGSFYKPKVNTVETRYSGPANNGSLAVVGPNFRPQNLNILPSTLKKFL